MPSHINPGDNVLVPVGRITIDGSGNGQEMPDDDLFIATKVIAKVKKTLLVDLAPKLPHTGKVAASAVHRFLGILLVQLGDFDSEVVLLDPLKSTLGNFCRLLSPHIFFKEVTVRSKHELAALWVRVHDQVSHVIVAGHGDTDCVVFGVDGEVTGEDFAKIFEDPLTLLGSMPSQGKPGPFSSKVFVSLCCKTGRASFAGSFSKRPVCSALIAPMQSVHAALASQFAQNLFAHHFVDGRSIKVALKRSRNATPRGLHFREWRKGKIVSMKSSGAGETDGS